MQYKIPLQIENEDEIVFGLSLRQLAIMGGFGGVAYALFSFSEPRIGGTMALIIAAPIAVTGIIIALIKIAEMTFLPIILNMIRLSLNSKERPWSQGTDSYSELEIGYLISGTWATKEIPETQTFAEMITKNDDFSEKLKNL